MSKNVSRLWAARFVADHKPVDVDEVRPMRPKLTRNAAMCRQCKEIIESKFRHDFKHCGCGAICIDGGLSYVRGGGKNLNDWISLAEYEEDQT